MYSSAVAAICYETFCNTHILWCDVITYTVYYIYAEFSLAIRRLKRGHVTHSRILKSRVFKYTYYMIYVWHKRAHCNSKDNFILLLLKNIFSFHFIVHDVYVNTLYYIVYTADRGVVNSWYTRPSTNIHNIRIYNIISLRPLLWSFPTGSGRIPKVNLYQYYYYYLRYICAKNWKFETPLVRRDLGDIRYIKGIRIARVAKSFRRTTLLH